jgi:hypothetical protein
MRTIQTATLTVKWANKLPGAYLYLAPDGSWLPISADAVRNAQNFGTVAFVSGGSL